MTPEYDAAPRSGVPEAAQISEQTPETIQRPPPADKRLTGNRCLCRACGEYLNSVSVFDEHRVAGRCLTVEQMTARGWLVNPSGFWISRQRGESRAQARTRGQFGRLPAGPVHVDPRAAGALEMAVSS